MGIPVVVASNGLGLPVRQVQRDAPLMTVADNGQGIPIVLSDLGAPFVVEGLGPDPTVFDASGLTLSTSYTGPTIVPSAYGGTFGVETQQPIVLVARQVTFPDPFSEYLLTEMGGNTIGCAAYLTSAGEFVIRAGDGSLAITDPAVTGFAFDLAGTVSPGETWDIAIEFDPTMGSSRLWIGSTLVQSSAAASYTDWAGADDGGYLTNDGSGSRPSGVPGVPWPEPAGDLEVYFNQVVP